MYRKTVNAFGQSSFERLKTYSHPLRFGSKPFMKDQNPQSRGEIHSSGLWHSSIHVWFQIKSPSLNGLLLQRRSSLKDTYPGFWDISCAGHIDEYSSAYETVFRELGEELNIDLAPINQSSDDPVFIVSPSVIDAPVHCGECEIKTRHNTEEYLKFQTDNLNQWTQKAALKVVKDLNVNVTESIVSLSYDEEKAKNRTLAPVFICADFANGGPNILNTLDCEFQYVYLFQLKFDSDSLLNSFMKSIAENCEPGEVDRIGIADVVDILSHWKTSLNTAKPSSFNSVIQEWVNPQNQSKLSESNFIVPRPIPYVNIFEKLLNQD